MSDPTERPTLRLRDVMTRADPALVSAKELPARGPVVQPGTRLGPYELIRILGRGGMGQVFVARDTKLGRLVAIKIVLDAGPELAARFLAEARTTARCVHENIVVIHDVAEHDGRPYMVLEYLEGETLASMLDGPLPAARALELVIPVVRALVRAHEHKIVHRDLKPENVVLTDAGTIKVLDFGVAKALESAEVDAVGEARRALPDEGPKAPYSAVQTAGDRVVGTPPYMAPEQLQGGTVDGRTDIWAVGIILHELIAGRHPLGTQLTYDELLLAAIHTAEPMPSLAIAAPGAPPEVARVVDRCLAKRPSERFQSAAALLAELEACAAPEARPRADEDHCPYPGLGAFQADDTDRYFGRAAEVLRAVQRLRDQPLLAIAAPSGAGKSSFVRAGLAPALARSADGWEIATTRPGREPLLALARLLGSIDELDATDGDPARERALADRLRAEPGYLGSRLRARAARHGKRLLVFIDQFEELFTLVATPEDRLATTACLAAVADHPDTPLRLVLALRSDFVDRAVEDPVFLAQLTRGLHFLGPLDRAALEEALTRPAQLAGYRFESRELVDEMLDALELTSGALPLLQFAASTLWAHRDRARHLLTAESHRAMGGLAGALATHADQVVADLTPAARAEARRVLIRLVTPDRTRALVDRAELLTTAADRALASTTIDQLAGARLLVVHTEGAEPTVELVHESLLTRWPRLARWIEESKEGVAFVAELRTAARQWHERGRAPGLLWQGDALDDAAHARARHPDVEIGDRERAFLDAAFAQRDRARRVRRRWTWAGLALLGVIAASAVIALWSINVAEHESRLQAERARDQAERVLTAQARADAEQKERQAAQRVAADATAQVVAKDETLREANDRLEGALLDKRAEAERANAARVRAEAEAKRAQAAEAELGQRKRELEASLAAERERAARLEQRLTKISTELK